MNETSLGDRYIAWGARGLAGALGLAEEGIRAGHRPSGEARQTLLAMSVRCLLAADGVPIPADVRTWQELIEWLDPEVLPWNTLSTFCGTPTASPGWRSCSPAASSPATSSPPGGGSDEVA